jgi:hypothetical protein
MKQLSALSLSHSWGAVHGEFPHFPQFPLPPYYPSLGASIATHALPAEF